MYDYESDNIILIRIDKVLEIEKVGESKSMYKFEKLARFSI